MVERDDSDRRRRVGDALGRFVGGGACPARRRFGPRGGLLGRSGDLLSPAWHLLGLRGRRRPVAYRKAILSTLAGALFAVARRQRGTSGPKHGWPWGINRYAAEIVAEAG